MKKNVKKTEDKAKLEVPLPGNPVYSAKDDIYNNQKKEEFTEDDVPVNGLKKPIPSPDEDLDIPGAELDDDDEILGEEDEENNYYSLGGDNHENLEEDQSI
jgi:hypothetical protein